MIDIKQIVKYDFPSITFIKVTQKKLKKLGFYNRVSQKFI